MKSAVIYISTTHDFLGLVIGELNMRMKLAILGKDIV